MFIRELHVDGYGRLHNVCLTLESPVTVIYGPNEAGKSTLLRFIRSMLYGIPSRKDPVGRGEPVFGGRHGGRLLLLAADGGELLVERHADGAGSLNGRKAAGGLLVREADGSVSRMSQAEWERRVLGGISERLFRQLFAVSLDELHELLTLQGEEIGNFLYHAGLAGGASLAVVRRRLAAEMDKLYRPRGATQEMNRLLASIKELETAIRHSRGGIASFQETQDQWIRTQRQLAETEERLPQLALRVAEYKEALSLREWWLKRGMITSEEADLALRLPDPVTPPLTEEAAAEWTGLSSRRRAAAERMEQAARAVAEKKAAYESLKWDETLLERTEQLERLEAMREAAAARRDETESVAAELRLLDENIETLIGRLSPNWKADDLASFTAVLSEREPLLRLQAEWSAVHRARERLEADRSRLERQRDALAADMLRFADAPEEEGGADRSQPRALPFGPFRSATRERLLMAWNSLEDEWRRYERSSMLEQIRPDVAVGRSGRKNANGGMTPAAAAAYAVSGVLLLAALGSAIAGWASADGVSVEQPYILATGIAALFAVLAGWAGRRWRYREARSQAHSREWAGSPLRDHAQRIEACLGELMEHPELAAAALLHDPRTPDRRERQESTYQLLRKSLQAEIAALDSRERELDRSRERKRGIAVIGQEIAALESELRDSKARLEALLAEWSEWLSGRKLPQTLTPDSVSELLHIAEQAQVALRRRTRTMERLAALEQLQDVFLETAAALFAVFPPPASLASDAALSAAWLSRRASEQRAVKEEARHAERSLRDAEAEAAEASKSLQKAEADMLHVISLAGAADEQAYRLRLEVDERRRALQRERKEIELRLTAGKTAEAVEKLYRMLENNDEAALTTGFKQAEEAWQSAERHKAELLDQRGRLAQELKSLRDSAETEERRLRLSELESRLEQLAERYAILAVADRLLQQTKAVFEEERQPEVLRIASEYFKAMTDGAYRRISAPDGTSSIIAETRDGRPTDSAFLSRGTQEQLYLAMRFALAEAASPDVPLPLLLDDLFVHFDERRLKLTVPVLDTLARTRQIVLFSCHRHVAEAIAQTLADARIVNLEERGAASRSAAPDPG